jgi:hypothetical protein
LPPKGRAVNEGDTTGFDKSDKKTTITFAIDNRILNIIRGDANSHKISVNANVVLALNLYLKNTKGSSSLLNSITLSKYFIASSCLPRS